MINSYGKLISRRNFLKLGGINVLAFVPTLLFARTATPIQSVNAIENLVELAQLINAYRRQHQLAKIPISLSLTTVALSHVLDLNTQHPERTCGEKGNLHSWSENKGWQGDAGMGAWKGCCYADDHSNAACMWNKPKEITGYIGNGYEIVMQQSVTVIAQDALKVWKSSPQHNNMILNRGIWSEITWQGFGAVYGGNYACAWFGY